MSSSPKSITDLPIEIIIQILSYVDPLTLRVVPSVCKIWHDVLNDDAVWNAIFKLTFPMMKSKANRKGFFSSVSRSKMYRTELLIRSHLLHEYQKGRMVTQSYFISPSSHSVQLATGAPVPVPLRISTLPVRNLESIHVNWIKYKLTILDVPQDTLIACNLRTGKNSSAVQDFVPEGVTCYDWNSKLCVFGRWDNSISGGFIDHKGLLMSKVKSWGKMTPDEISIDNRRRVCCVCIVDKTPPATSIIPNETRKINKGDKRFVTHHQGSPASSSSSLSLSHISSLSPSTNTRTNIISHSTSTILGKEGTISVFSGDESGRISAWDVKTNEIIWSHTVEEDTQVRKLDSDGKTVLISLLENGNIWVFKNIFDKKSRQDNKIVIEKIGNLRIGSTNVIDKRSFRIDYGGENIIYWNEQELVVFSYATLQQNQPDQNENNNFNQLSDLPPTSQTGSESRRYLPPPDTIISKIALEDNAKLFTKKIDDIVGGDPLLAAICLNNGVIHIINVRDSEWDMHPISIIKPKFLHEKDSSHVEIIDDRISQVASLAINSLVLFVSNHLGKVELFDVTTGAFLRVALNKLSMTRLNQLEHFIREQGGNVLKIDERGARGILIIGSYVQYFCFGDDLSFIEQQNGKRLKKGKNKSKGSMNTIKNNIEDYEYQKEIDDSNLDQRLQNMEKFNGDSNPDLDLEKDEELRIAMALSLSLNDTGSDNRNENYSHNENCAKNDAEQSEDELEQLRKAMELSLQEAQNDSLYLQSSVYSYSSSFNETSDQGASMDDDLKLAIELSKQEQSNAWECRNYDEGQWQKFQ